MGTARPRRPVVGAEILTDQTTCSSEMPKKITSECKCSGGGMLPRHRAATAGGGRAHHPAFVQCAATTHGGKSCRHRLRRHVRRVAWPACRHGSFDICTHRWSFLVFHWGRWSDLSKFRWSYVAVIFSLTYTVIWLKSIKMYAICLSLYQMNEHKCLIEFLLLWIRT